MILLTRYGGGERISVNSDHIERIEETPDTVVTLTNGSKHVVQESVEEITAKIQLAKATTLALAWRLAEDPDLCRVAPLHVVRDDDSSDEVSDAAHRHPSAHLHGSESEQ